MTTTLQLLPRLSLALAVGLASGCKNDGNDDAPSEPTSSTAASDSSGPGATGQNPTSDSTGETTSGGGTVATIGSTGPTCPMDRPNGETCAGPCDCESEQCFMVGALGAVCSECDADEDCAKTGFGCNFGNPLTGMPALCSATGELGEGCETTDACADGLVCTELIEVPGVISAATCSGCMSDDDCTGGQLCAPTYDIEVIAGHFRCVDPMTVPDDEGCALPGSGNEQCMSMNCAPASVMGIQVVSVCSVCNEAQDCVDLGMGFTDCVLPELAIDGTMLSLVPAMCV